jgi:5-methylcytosine-specific restriction endonuclease McrA
MMGRDCWAHHHRDDVPLELHHVWPRGEGGPDTKANRVSVCSNAHSSTHDLLTKMMKAHTQDIPWRTRMRYGRKVRRLAVAGYLATITRKVVQP